MNEQAKVGLLVLMSAALLVIGVFAVANLHVGQYAAYKTYFKFAGGLEPGAAVRYGGLKVGRVKSLHVDADNPTKIEVNLEVKGDTPVRTDSQAGISQLGFLGENYVEIKPGQSGGRLPPGSTIPSVEAQDLGELMRKMNALADQATVLITDVRKNLDQISGQADKLLANLQDITGEQNRQHLASIMKQTDEMIRQTSPKIDALMTDLRNTDARLDTVLNNANGTISNVNGMLTENRENIRAAIAELEKTLVTTRAMVDQLNTVIAYNSENLDTVLVNFRQISQNFKDFSDTLKQRPFSLIRIKPLPDREPPGAAPARNQKSRAARQRAATTGH